MNNKFYQIEKNMYKLEVPIEDFYTAVFLIIDGKRKILVDSASYATDVINYILPGLNSLDIIPTDIVITHTHFDHIGGLNKLIEVFPSLKIYIYDTNYIKNLSCIKVDNDLKISDHITLLYLPGHTLDTLGIYDERSETLLSCDSLEFCGIGNYGTDVVSLEDYFKSINRIRGLGAQAIYASHEFVPLGSTAKKDDINNYLDECINEIYRLRDFALNSKYYSAKALSYYYNKSTNNPPVEALMFEEIKKYFKI